MVRLMLVLAAASALLATPAAADAISDAIEAARRAYQAGDLPAAKQALDQASQLIGQRNAQTFSTFLPEPLPGWTAEPVQTVAVGNVGFGATTASRVYNKSNGDSIEVQITGDSTIIRQYATLFSNPAVAGAMAKMLMVGNYRALQNMEGDLHMIVADKYLVAVQGNASPNDKLV